MATSEAAKWRGAAGLLSAKQGGYLFPMHAALVVPLRRAASFLGRFFGDPGRESAWVPLDDEFEDGLDQRVMGSTGLLQAAHL